MADEKPDIGPLERAIQRLNEGWIRYQQNISDTQIRDGLIQRFEFTYEISHRMLKRFLEYASPTPEQFEQMTFQDLIRTGNEQGLLLRDWPAWKQYRDMRSKTSHTYDEDVALEVAAGILTFLEEVYYLAAKLKERLA
ncbi:MAG: nucleotidyltransferase substrate binding protein [Candidatus Accumulibacter sp.]|jgi:nucleotidyltransferase substrate binding protein (TIGR01987 family)|nr:nucleotidyltransferase substrate binding protein [Accumulibacter sp.]